MKPLMFKGQDRAIRFISKLEKNSESNMKLFIRKAKSCSAFGGVKWSDPCWNITDNQIKDRGHKQREYNLWFTQHGTKKPKIMGQFFSEPFSSFAKALIRLQKH